MDDIIYILDACAFIKEGFLLQNSHIYICPYSVAEEIKSPNAQIRFDCMRKQGFIEFVNPKQKFIEYAKKLEHKAKQKNGKLSKTDIDIIALAIE